MKTAARGTRWPSRRPASQLQQLLLLLVAAALATGPWLGQSRELQDESPVLYNRFHFNENAEPALEDEPGLLQEGSAGGGGNFAAGAGAVESGGLAPAAGALSGQFQCERIEFDFCSTMPFNLTRMPNFFADKSQIEAAERARHYEPLLRSRCSAHLLAYLCELLAPMCLDNGALKRFEIFPCRSYCRHIKRECEPELAKLYQQLGVADQAFACDRLPYEANGGEGSLNGPCHETPPEAPRGHANRQPPPPPTGYWPYQPALDNPNVPPFITDTSKIELELLKQPPVEQHQQQIPRRHQQQANVSAAGGGGAGGASSPLLHQLQSAGQLVAVNFYKYSNLISLVALVCLLLVLNAKRLQRLKARLAPACCPSTASSQSSGSSSGSKRKLAAAASLASSRQHQQHRLAGHKGALSPSASSRSLMLFAGGNSSAPPQHKLLAEQAHLDHLQPAQNHQKTTLISVDGTGERRQNRYQLDPHEYDYIQVNALGGLEPADEPRPTAAAAFLAHKSAAPDNHFGKYQRSPSSSNSAAASAATPQLLKNILLSSPSHQVLLFGDGGAGNQRRASSNSASSARLNQAPLDRQQQQQQQLGYLSSHYAAASLIGGGGGNGGSPFHQPSGFGHSYNPNQQQQQLFVEHQRSFSRRDSAAAAARRRQLGQARPAAGAHAHSASSASSSAGSSSSPFSSPPAADRTAAAAAAGGARRM